MRMLRQDVLYALRQMRLSPIFTLTAMLTLALGIGATTAIFSLIHTVMLKSLPVADPASLYRVGEGNDCCVEGGPQDNWGMFSYRLYQSFGAAAPEFEQLAAFQAGRAQFSVRRSETNEQAKPLRGEFVSGNYFATFGVQAFTGRTLTPTDDQPSSAPAAMLSHRLWQQEYASDPKVVGSTFMLDGHPFTIVGITPPGFYGETLRSDPPEIFVPLQQEPLLMGKNSILKQSNGWLRIIGRLRPGAKPDGLAARFTTILRQWLVTDLGAEFPQFLSQIKAILPKQKLNVIPAGSGVAEMKAGYKDSLRILLAVCSLVLADCLRQYRQPAAGAGIGSAHSNSSSTRTGSFENAPHSPVAHGERCALGNGRRGGNRDCLPGGKAHCCADLPICELCSDRRDSFAACIGLRLWLVSGHWTAVRHGAGVVYIACGTCGGNARFESEHARQVVAVAEVARRGAGHVVGRVAYRRRAADAEYAEDGAPGLRL